MIDLNKITRYKMSLNGTVLDEDPQGELVFFSDVEEALKEENEKFSNIDEETFNRIAKDMKGE